LADIFDLTCPHFTHIISVSLHPSITQGKKHNHPVAAKRQMPQAIATQPIFFLGMFPV